MPDTDPAALEVAVRLAPAAAAGGVADWLREAEAYETAGAQVLWIGDPEPGVDAGVLVAALAAVTYRATLVMATGTPPTEAALATLQAVAHDRVVLPEDEGLLPDGRQWAEVPAPQGRAAWRESLQAAAAAGAAGVLVPASPRLLDILRNPADPEGRQDLHISVG